MTMHTATLGTSVSRVDGSLKVTGQARYAGEFTAHDLAYGVVISSAIAKGAIASIDTAAALAVPGVLKVFTHQNRPKVASNPKSYQDQIAPPGEPLRPLGDATIHFSGQPVALVVAEDFETARYAASLVEVSYAVDDPVTDLDQERGNAYVPQRKRDGYTPPASPRGHAEKVFDKAPHKVAAEYSVTFEHHNPMEMFATTVVWEGEGKLTVYDKIQGVLNSQLYVTNVFGLKKADVRVLSPFVGGAFGSGLRPQHQLFMAVMAALDLQRSVKVTLTRQQMFSFGYRPHTIQRLAVSTDHEGQLTSLQHHALANTSRIEDYMETVVNWAGLLYKCDNTHFTHKLAALDLPTPQDMRAPGAATGVFAIESAIDEMADAIGADSLEFRIQNYSDRDQNTNKPYTSKALMAAYRLGAERFGWTGRSVAPRSMRDGKELIGWGVATGVWEAAQQKSAAKATLHLDGTLEVGAASADIGTGTYTIMTQIAAETLGLRLDAVMMRLGDTLLPEAPIEGGSWTAASVGSAIQNACQAVQKRLVTLARGLEDSPLANADLNHVVFADGRISLVADPSRFVPLRDALAANGKAIEETGSAAPSLITKARYSSYTHSANFVEVRVDEDLRSVRVTRVVTAVAAGRILNTKTARSQILGGVVMGIGMALTEETMPDMRLGRFMNHNFAEYHIPVNADIHDIDVLFVPEQDDEINPLGIKGLGEIGIVGTAAAIANAIFHATGQRVRDLPITIDKLLDGPAG